MDKYEYKIKEDEIKELIKMRAFDEAAEVADTIDWRRVKSVKMLCMVSDVYKKNRRYEDSRDMLLLAYDRHPGGRTIVYSLCELAIKMDDLGNALEYCKEFIRLAPKDPGRYILQYKLYEAQEVGLEERIAVLEELKKRDYREKWAYELALLYHRVGMETRCVEECDELIVWFGEGKYVIKAMELKMQHQPLTPQQQEKYDNRFKKPEPVTEEVPEVAEADVDNAATIRIPAEEIDIQVKPLGLSQCDTINLQAEVAAGLKEYLDKSEPQEEKDIDFELANTAEFMLGVLETAELELAKESFAPANVSEEAEQELETITDEEEELPAELASVLEESEEPEESEEIQEEDSYVEEIEPEENEEETVEEVKPHKNAHKPEELDWQAKEMAKVLSVEGDGQISFVVPEAVALEKQITGQMNFNDILLEWERMKLELEEKRKENVRQMVIKNTGAMFTEFEASVRDGLLEQLEKGKTVEEVLPQAERLVRDKNGFEALEKEQQPKEEEIDEAIDSFEELEVVEDGEASEEEEIGEAVELFEELEVTESEATTEEVIDEAAEEFEELEEVEIQEEIDETEDTVIEEDLVESEETESEEEFEEIEEVEVEEELEELKEAEAEEEELEESEETEVEEELEQSEEAEAEEELEESEETEVEEEQEESEEIEAEEELEEGEETEAEEEPEESEEAEETEESESEEAEQQAEEAFDVVDDFDDAESDSDDSNKENASLRSMSKEARELFAPYIQGRQSKAQLMNALDTVSLAAYTGNIVITGREGLDTIGLARSLIRYIQQEDTNFSGKVAKISGNSLNKRNIPEIVEGLVNGALIIQKAEDINEATAKSLYRVFQQETRGIIVVLEGTKRAINTFFDKYSILEPCFNARIDMEALSNEALVSFAKKYAREQEYSIDEFGMLALHRVIAERQTSDHAVTIMEVKEIMDAAIDSANRKSIGHFFAILAAKRYDEEDMIIIREKDFL